MVDMNLSKGGKKLHGTLEATDRYPLAFVTGATVKSFTIALTAVVKRIVLEMPAFSGANPTSKFTIENSNSKEIYESPSTVMVEDEIHVISTSIPLAGEYTIKVTLSTNPLSSGTAYVTLYLEGN